MGEANTAPGETELGKVGSRLPLPAVKPPELYSRGTIHELTPRERVAFRLTLLFAGLISIPILACIFDWLWNIPRTPDLSHLSPESQKATLEAFVTANRAITGRISAMFDLIVVKATLPLLATAVGYLIGRRS